MEARIDFLQLILERSSGTSSTASTVLHPMLMILAFGFSLSVNPWERISCLQLELQISVSEEVDTQSSGNSCVHTEKYNTS